MTHRPRTGQAPGTRLPPWHLLLRPGLCQGSNLTQHNEGHWPNYRAPRADVGAGAGARSTQGPDAALRAQRDEAHADHKGHSGGAVGQAYFPVGDGEPYGRPTPQEAGRRPALEGELDGRLEGALALSCSGGGVAGDKLDLGPWSKGRGPEPVTGSVTGPGDGSWGGGATGRVPHTQGPRRCGASRPTFQTRTLTKEQPRPRDEPGRRAERAPARSLTRVWDPGSKESFQVGPEGLIRRRHPGPRPPTRPARAEAVKAVQAGPPQGALGAEPRLGCG